MGRRTRKRLRNTEAQVICSEMTWEGRFTSHLEGERLHVLGGVPGATVQVDVTGESRKKLQATVKHYESAPDWLRKARCSHFLSCGGCRLQHLPEEQQRIYKRDLLRETLDPFMQNREDSWLGEVVASPDSFEYRMKMEFTFEELREGRALGMHAQGSFHHILPLKECHLMPKVSQRVFALVRDWYETTEIEGYNPFRHTGFLRHLVLRASQAEERVLVGISTREWHPGIQELADSIQKLAGVSGVHWLHSPSEADAVSCENSRCLSGEDTIEEKLGELRFRISLPSFFQVNPLAARRLYDVIGEELASVGATGGRLLDLYCGTGSIGLYLASRYESVLGLEEVEPAIMDAWHNARINGIENVEFEAVKVENAMEEKIRAFQPDAMVVDPPRSGCHPRARKMMASLRIPHLVFVSCNPKLLPENLQEFLDEGYEIRRVIPIDMFPQTPHLEAVLLLSLKE